MTYAFERISLQQSAVHNPHRADLHDIIAFYAQPSGFSVEDHEFEIADRQRGDIGIADFESQRREILGQRLRQQVWIRGVVVRGAIWRQSTQNTAAIPTHAGTSARKRVSGPPGNCHTAPAVSAMTTSAAMTKSCGRVKRCSMRKYYIGCRSLV